MSLLQQAPMRSRNRPRRRKAVVLTEGPTVRYKDTIGQLHTRVRPNSGPPHRSLLHGARRSRDHHGCYTKGE
jgi:hypothetical protein